jgi:glycine betaine/proline transport system substrate-binding protein
MLLKKREFLGLSAGLAMGLTTGAARAQSSHAVKLGFSAWADAEFITKLAAKLIQDRLGTPVDLIQTDVAPLYQGIARGDVDAMLMCWLPQTHADYWKRVEDKVEQLGTLYSGAKLGWVVPAYVPESEIASIADLAKPEVRRKLSGRVQGIEPGAGLTRLSQEALKAYDLNYTLQESSEAAMLSMVDRATRNNRWVVATAWSPHWMFGKYELRYLADAKAALGGEERVHALGRRGLGKDRPKVAAFLSRLNVPLDDLQVAMLVAQEKDYDTAVAQYLSRHAERVNGWFAEG